MRGRYLGVSILMLLLAACSGSTAETTTTTGAVTTTSTAVVTTTVETTTTTVPDTTTSSAAEAQPVGDPALLEAQFNEIIEGVALVYEDYSADPLPAPNFSDPDPIEALRAILEFDELVFETYPIPDLVRLYTLDGSNAQREFGETAARLFGRGQVVVNNADPAFELSDLDVRTLEQGAAILPLDALDGVPPDAVIVTFIEVLSAGSFSDRATGEVAQALPQQSFQGAAVMAPTPSGWKWWHYELEEIQ